VGVQLRNCVIDDSFNQTTVAPLALQKFVLRSLTFGDVARDLDKTNEFALLATDRVDDHKGQKSAAILNTPALSSKTTRLAEVFNPIWGSPLRRALAM